MKIYSWAGLFILAFFPIVRASAIELTGNLGGGGISSTTLVPTSVVQMPSVGSSSGTFSVFSSASQSGFSQATVIHAANEMTGFSININAGPTLAAMPEALAAFQRAAQQWTSVFSNPITVTIDADMADLGTTGIIGQSNAVSLMAPYDVIRNQVVASAAMEGSHDALAAALPTASQFQVAVPQGFTLSGYLYSTKANLKAVGFEGLDADFGASDGTIEFNSQFPFTYNRSGGVAAGTIDFESVAAHEIGHELGFMSSVDDIDYAKATSQTGSFMPTILDLYRFSASGANHPTTVGQFTTLPRELAPGYEENFIGSKDISAGTLADSEYAMSTGYYTGDGQQASHWKESYFTGNYIGIMNPTIGYGEIHPITDADIRALDLIGYATVPEPGFFVLLGGAAMCSIVFAWNRRGRIRS